MNNVIESTGYTIMTEENEVLAFDQETSTDIEVYLVEKKWASSYRYETKEEAQRVLDWLQGKEESPWNYCGEGLECLDGLKIVKIKETIEFFE